MDSIPTIPQRPKRSKDLSERAEVSSGLLNSNENKAEPSPIAPQVSSVLTTPPIPSRPKKKTEIDAASENDANIELGQPSLESGAVSTLTEQPAESLVTPESIISDYEAELEDTSPQFADDPVANSPNMEEDIAAPQKAHHNDSESVQAYVGGIAQDAASSIIPDQSNSTEKASEIVEITREVSDTESERPVEDKENARSPNSEIGGSIESKPDIPNIPQRPKPKTEPPAKSLQSPKDYEQESGDDEQRLPGHVEIETPSEAPLNETLLDAPSKVFETEDTPSGDFKKSSTLSSEESSVASNILSETPEEQTAQVPSVPSRPQPIIPTRPSRKKETSVDSDQSESSLAKEAVQEIEDSGEASNYDSGAKSIDSSQKKAPPPKPKKLSSKIAAFQQMFNQEPPQKPPVTRQPSEERSKLSSDRSNFAASLSSMMGRGIALPGMANPEMMKKLSADNADGAESESREQDVTDTAIDTAAAAPRRARGPRGKRLPKSIKESQVEIKSRFTVHSADLWEVEFKREVALEVAAKSKDEEDNVIISESSETAKEAPEINPESLQEPFVDAVEEAEGPESYESISENEAIASQVNVEEPESGYLQTETIPHPDNSKTDVSDAASAEEVTKTFVIPTQVVKEHNSVEATETSVHDGPNSSSDYTDEKNESESESGQKAEHSQASQLGDVEPALKSEADL